MKMGTEMKTEIIEFAGDVPGNAIELRVLRFAGKDSDAPTAYLQSSLHGGELPGCPAFSRSDAEKSI
jgi:predicted deacylase